MEDEDVMEVALGPVPRSGLKVHKSTSQRASNGSYKPVELGSYDAEMFFIPQVHTRLQRPDTRSSVVADAGRDLFSSTTDRPAVELSNHNNITDSPGIESNTWPKYSRACSDCRKNKDSEAVDKRLLIDRTKQTLAQCECAVENSSAQQDDDFVRRSEGIKHRSWSFHRANMAKK